jgi:TP901 family phage tail tape measure protein
MLGEAFKVFAVFSLVDEFTRPFREIQNNLQEFDDKVKKVTEHLNEISKRYTELGAGFAAAGAGLLAGFAAPVKAAADFQEAMADVNKVANFTTKEYAEFSSKLLELSERIPLAVEDLASLAAAGAQMGVAKKDLLYFTETVAKLATAFDMPAGQIGDIMGKLANVFKIPIARIGELGDVINELSNNVAANAPGIVEVLSRIGGTAASIGMSAKEAAALGAAMLALGETPERAGTALNDMLNTLANLSVQPKKVKEAIEELGFSTEELEQEIREKPIPTLLNFFQVLRESGEASKYLNLIFGIEPGPKLIKLVNDTQVLPKVLGIIGDKAKYAGSAQKEFETRASTLNCQLQILKNTFRHIAIAMGTVFLPPLTRLAQMFQSILSPIARFAEKHKTLSMVLLGSAGAIGLFLAGIGSAFLAIGLFTRAIATGIEGIAELRKGLRLLSGYFSVLRGKIFGAVQAVWSWIASQWTSLRSTIANAGGLRALAVSYAGRLIGAIRSAVAAVWSFNTALLANPITWVVGAIVALGGVLYWLQKRFGLLTKAWEGIKHGLNWLKEKFLSFGTWLKTHWKSVLKVFLWVNPITAPIMALNKLVQFVSGINLFEAGKKILLTLVNGIKAVALKPYEAVKSILSKVRNLLPFSPAKEGPLADLHIAGKKLLGTVAEGVDGAVLVSQVSKALSTLAEGLKLPEPGALTVPVKWMAEHFKLPELNALTVPVKWMAEHLKLPSLEALTVPVKWMAEYFKLPKPSELKIPSVKRAAEGTRGLAGGAFPAVSIHLTQNISVGEGSKEDVKTALKTSARDFEEAVYRALMRVLERNRRLSFAGEA